MKVLICDPVEKEVVEFLKKKLEVEEGGNPNGTDADALIVRSRTKITRDIIKSARNLKVIGRQGVGLDNIDLEAAKEKRVVVINTPEALTESVAELAVGLMFSLARDIPKADKGMKEGTWLKGKLRQIELSGKTVGILGLGKIGLRVAELCKSLGMPIIYWSRTRKPEIEDRASITYVAFDELFKKADIISIHLALTPETEKMVGWRELSMMKPSGFLINTARGAVIDEEDLCKALREEKIAGAGLDVFTQEPYNGILEETPNLVLTPHVGSDTREAQLRSGLSLAEKIEMQLGVR
jgi:D-3-phosphoglycerate dehydrogenase